MTVKYTKHFVFSSHTIAITITTTKTTTILVLLAVQLHNQYYCTDTILILYQYYSTDTILIIYQYYSIDIILILYQYYSIDTILIIYQHYYTDTILILYQYYCTDTILKLYQHYSQWRNSALIIGGTTFRRGVENFGGGYKLLYPTMLSFGGGITPPCPPGIAPMTTAQILY